MKNTGGPAFPGIWRDEVDGAIVDEQRGMTLRDYFAIRMIDQVQNAGSVEDACKMAYEFADAMLKERER